VRLAKPWTFEFPRIQWQKYLKQIHDELFNPSSSRLLLQCTFTKTSQYKMRSSKWSRNGTLTLLWLELVGLVVCQGYVSNCFNHTLSSFSSPGPVVWLILIICLMSSLILGSVSDYLVHNAPCSVIVARDRSSANASISTSSKASISTSISALSAHDHQIWFTLPT
jgi:hypothetical protein